MSSEPLAKRLKAERVLTCINVYRVVLCGNLLQSAAKVF